MAARVWPVDAVGGSPSNTGRSLRQTSVSPIVGLATGSRPLGGLSGVRPGTPTTIATATSTTWTVTPFLGLVDGEAAAIAGVYAYSFDTNQTGSVTAAAGSARIDRLDVQVSDPGESDGSSNPGIAIVYTAGTPGSGSPAAAPARSHPLALINVPASGGGSPTVSWNASYYAAPGGFVPFNTLVGLQAWTTAAYGQHATVINDVLAVNNGDYFWTGSQWLGTGTTGLCIPSSVSGGTLVGGKLSFSSASSVSVNGVFSSAFDNYRVVVKLTANTGDVNMKLRSGGSDNSAAYVCQRLWVNNGGTVSANHQYGITGGWILTANTNGFMSTTIHLQSPALAEQTQGTTTFQSTGASMSSGTVGLFHNASFQADGFTLLSTGMTGSVMVYGDRTN